MVEKRIRKGKKPLFMYVDEQLHDLIKERAKFRHMPVSQWILLAIYERIQEENKYL